MNETYSNVYCCTGSWNLSSLLWSDTRMAKLNHVKEMEILNRNFMDDVVSFNEYKEKANSILNDTPDEMKVKVANAALFVSLAVH